MRVLHTPIEIEYARKRSQYGVLKRVDQSVRWPKVLLSSLSGTPQDNVLSTDRLPNSSLSLTEA